VRQRWRIIVNPVSGRGRGAGRARAVAAALPHDEFDVEIVETHSAGDARRLASPVGADVVIAVGGDGTVNEVLNGLPEPFPILGHIPSGTGNTLAKELRMDRSVAGLVRLFRSGRVRPWDLAIERTTGKRFLLFLTAGYDAHVVHRFHAQRRGTIYQWEYFLWGLKCVPDFPIPRIAVEIDGRVLTEQASWIQISNVAQYGGPLVFTPRARPDDGALEVMVYHARDRRDVPRMFLRAILGWACGWEYRMRDLTFHRARRVRLWSADARAVPTQIDGDPGPSLPAEVELVPGGLRILTPPTDPNWGHADRTGPSFCAGSSG